MTIKNKMISACLMCLVVFSVVGCSPKDGEKSNNFISTQNMELIYEETISPNKEYVEKEEDIVNYTVEVYQDDDHMIFVNANLILQVFNRYNMKLRLVRILQRKISISNGQQSWGILLQQKRICWL